MNKSMKNWLRRLFPSRKPMSKQERRRAKALLLGTGAGAAIRPDIGE